jgi:hypothetical protein
LPPCCAIFFLVTCGSEYQGHQLGEDDIIEQNSAYQTAVFNGFFGMLLLFSPSCIFSFGLAL